MQVQNEVQKDEFRVGDEVWCLLYGKGVVTYCGHEGDYPVEVAFENADNAHYTLDGRYYKEANRTLFFSEPKIEASVTRPFAPTLVGKKVVVRQKGCYDVMLSITYEDKDMFGNPHYTFEKNITEVYEVSSENLLK